MPEWYGFAVNVDAGKAMNPDVWETALTKGDRWRFNVCRLPFLFKAETSAGGVPAYTFTAVDAILTRMAAHGVKAVLDYHCIKQFPNNPKVGSQELIDGWKTVVQHYVNDGRIVAWEIANEPTSDLFASGVTTNLQKWNAIVALVNAIRTVDPVRPVVIPPSLFWGDSTVPGAVPPNCILSIHPYDYGTDPSWAALKKIADYRISKAKAYAPLFSGVWCGEFEGHTSVTGITPAQEQQYVVYMLNDCIANKRGFSLWKYNNATDDGKLDQDAVIAATNYVIPAPADPCQPYKDQAATLQGQLTALNNTVTGLNAEKAALSEIIGNQTDTINVLDEQIDDLQSLVVTLKAKMDTARATLTY